MKRQLTSAQLRQLRSLPSTGQNRVGQAMRLIGAIQQEVADGTGLVQPYISSVVTNRFQTITVDNAHKFARFFGCAVEDLFPAREEMAS